MSNRGTGRRIGRPPAEEMAEGARRTQILHVANELFGRRGYASVSIGDIAEQVGVTKAAIYHHFSSKDVLYTAVMVELLGMIRAGIYETVCEPIATQTKIRELAEIAIVTVSTTAELETMLRDAAEHLSAQQLGEIEEAHRQVLAVVEELMAAGISSGELKPGNPKLFAHAFWHLIAAFGGRRGLEAGFQGRDETAAEVVDLFLNGVLAAPAASAINPN